MHSRLAGMQCKGCKSEFLLDKYYEIICTNCGLCDSIERTKNRTEDVSIINVNDKTTSIGDKPTIESFGCVEITNT